MMIMFVIVGLGLDVAVLVGVDGVVDGVVGVDKWGWQIGGCRCGGDSGDGLVQSEVFGEYEVAKVDGEPAAPDGEPLEVTNVEGGWKSQLDVLRSVELALEDGCLFVFVFVEFALEGVCKDGSNGSGTFSGSDPEESIRALSVVLEVLDEDGLLVDGVDVALDPVLLRRQGSDLDTFFLLAADNGHDK